MLACLDLGCDIFGYTSRAEADVLLRLMRGVGVWVYCPVLRLGLSTELAYAYASLKSRMAASPGGWSSTRVSQEKGASDLSSLQPLTIVCTEGQTTLVPGCLHTGLIQTVVFWGHSSSYYYKLLSRFWAATQLPHRCQIVQDNQSSGRQLQLLGIDVLIR